MDRKLTIKELTIKVNSCRKECDGICRGIENNECACIDALSLEALKELEKANKEESKSYFFLKDLAEGCVDAVIIAKTSTAEDIKEAIMKAKENPEYQWDDLVNALPDDCEIVDKWSGIEEIYY